MRRLVNCTRGSVLATRVEHARKPWGRMRGLLGRTGLAEGEALCIEPCASIHTLFMRFAIDAAFVDADGRVVRGLRDLRPWRVTRLYLRATRVIELPAGTLARTNTEDGDTLAFDDEDV